MIIGQIAAGVGTVTAIQLQYLPQFLYWNNAVQLQNLTVNIVEDGQVVNLPAAGLNSVNGLGMYGLVANGTYLPVADGQVNNKVVTITATNGVAAAINLYGFSFGQGSRYVRSQVVPVLANQNVQVKSFGWCGMPAFVDATDNMYVTFRNGFVQQMTLVEIQAYLGLFQNQVAAASAGIYNLKQSVSEINVQVALAQNFYKVDYIAAGAVKNRVIV
jgi:hypothetical protein